MIFETFFSPKTLRDIGLEDYESCAPNEARMRRVVQAKEAGLAAALISKGMKELMGVVENEAKRIVWLKRRHGSVTAFASAAYPEIPGVVFMTDAVFCGLPPSVALSKMYDYCVIENLIHEAHHHDLEKKINSTGLRSSLQASVWIPWRSGDWTEEKALQALYIYKKVAFVRQWAISSGTFLENDLAAIVRSSEEVSGIISHLEAVISGEALKLVV